MVDCAVKTKALFSDPSHARRRGKARHLRQTFDNAPSGKCNNRSWVKSVIPVFIS